MGTESLYGRSGNFIAVDPARHVTQEPELPAVPAPDVPDKPDANYKAGLLVLAVAIPGAGAFLFGTFGLWGTLAGGAAGAGLVYGAHRARTGIADSRWRRRMGILRPGRRPGTLGRAVRAHTASAPRAARVPRLKPSGHGRARTPKAGAASASARGAVAKGWRDRLGRFMPGTPKTAPATRKAHRQQLDKVDATRRGKISRARAYAASAANWMVMGRWGRVLMAAIAAVLATIVETIGWVFGRDTSQPAAPATTGAVRPKPKAAPSTPGDVTGDAFDTDQDSDEPPPPATKGPDVSTSHPTPAQAQASTHIIHPCMEGLIKDHAWMFSMMPLSVLYMIEHLRGLAELYAEWADEINGLRAFFADQYPVQVVGELMADLAAQMTVNSDLARQTLDAYIFQNPGDVKRNTQPQVNEEWNNVEEDGVHGVDMGPLRRTVKEQIIVVFSYRPISPPDMRAWLRGLLPLFWQLESHVSAAYERGAFPGAGQEIASYWQSIASGYAASGGKGHVVAQAYEDEAAHILIRFDDPRLNESAANFRPSHSG